MIFFSERLASSYLKPNRLADVIAALQVMGADTRPEQKVVQWTRILSYNDNPDQVARWKSVFEEHGEFFLCYSLQSDPDTPKAALRLRYVNRNYDAETDTEYRGVARAELDREARNRLTTKPLSPDHVATLTKTAIELHSRAIAELADRRWWLPLIPALLTFIAAIAGFYVGSRKSDTDGASFLKLEISRPMQTSGPKG